ncbi:MAG: dihydroorotase [Solobacterium sp.]|nr:dihydroorotase [Solobacterium sp.]
MKRIIRNAKVLINGTLENLELLFDESGILEIAPHIEADAEITDASGMAVLPGLIDVHVHLREPGFEHKETIATGSKAAAHGGFTTIFAMPNLNPFPDNKQTMEAYLEKIRQDAYVNVIPYGTITKGEKGEEVSDMEGMKQLGIRWFSDDGVGVANDGVMEKAQKEVRRLDALMACHTEDMNYRRPGASVHDSPAVTENGWLGIPSECESAQLERDLKLAETTGLRYHGCHISAITSLNALRAAKAKGLDVSAEVTAHHLLLEDRDVKGPNWKMNPPLRTHEDRMALIEALEEGTLDFIASDHAPHTEADKNKPMANAAFGIISLETSFPLLYTEFVYKQKRWTLGQLVNWMSTKPAERFGLQHKGKIEKGYDADLILVSLGEESVINKNSFFSKGRNTPFDGWTVRCEVKETIVSGKTVWRKEA